MCGIAGYWCSAATDAARARLSVALDQMHRRGPDDRGTAIHSTRWGELGLGHARLSVIDLSANAHQPMASEDGRFVLAYNGEINNYRELRAELAAAGANFRTQSDTEVLLKAWTRWGSDCLPRLVGMFAFVIVDMEKGTLTCARDGFGIKPLYFAKTAWGFCFASELPAIVTLRGEGAALNLQRTYDYLVHGDYDSGEDTFVHGVSQLAPGALMIVDMRSAGVSASRWWTPSVTDTSDLSLEDASRELRKLLLESVRQHMRSDVPLGAALSGGIDSSAIVCAMRLVEPDAPINTFSFVAEDPLLSEQRWIDIVNGHVGASAHTIVIGPGDLARDLDDMIAAQGEPFGSTSIYAQYRVFKLARECGVTVTLDGQGADELLAGYQGYPAARVHSLLDDGAVLSAASFLHRWSKWPGRTLTGGLSAAAGEYLTGQWYTSLRGIARGGGRPDWIDADQLSERGVRLVFPRQVPDPSPRGRRMVAELALSATRRGLPALLRHADRNSMRFSVESRVPFLTVPIAEFLFGLPEHYLVSSSGETKHILRAAMRGVVPDVILDRRDKIGFATPELDWLSSLTDQAREWIGEAAGIGFLRKARMLQRFDEIVAGREKFSWQAWRWINFCRWHTRVFDVMNQPQTSSPSWP